MVLGQREVFHLLVDFSTVFLSVVSHENVLVYLCIFQKLILEYSCVARQGLKILPSLLLGIGVHELLVEALLSQLFAHARLLLICGVVDRVISTSKGQNRLKLTLIG